MGRYICSEHGVELVLRSMLVRHSRSRYERIEYFTCPVKGCDKKKPNKWQLKKVKRGKVS